MNFPLVVFIAAVFVQMSTAQDATTATPIRCNLPMCPALNCTNTYTPTPPANQCPGCPICCELLFCPAEKCEYGSTMGKQSNGCPGCPVCNVCPNLQLTCPRIVCPGGVVKRYDANGCEICPKCLQKPVTTA